MGEAKSYDCGIATNHDAWRAVHDGFADGLTPTEISGRTGISYGMVHQYRRQARPAGRVRALNRNHQGATYCACGRAKSEPQRVSCKRCSEQAQRAAANHHWRSLTLRQWAITNNRVPLVSEAAQILGIGRAIAGDAALAAFGPDERIGAQRSVSYRGFPPGAPDVPRPEMIAKLRKNGRKYAANLTYRHPAPKRRRGIRRLFSRFA